MNIYKWTKKSFLRQMKVLQLILLPSLIFDVEKKIG